MKGSVSTLHCDADDGACGEWSVDYYAETVSEVGVTRVTTAERAPGWTTTADGEDFCPTHSRQRESLPQGGGRLCQKCQTPMRYTLQDGSRSCWCGQLKERKS